MFACALVLGIVLAGQLTAADNRYPPAPAGQAASEAITPIGESTNNAAGSVSDSRLAPLGGRPLQPKRKPDRFQPQLANPTYFAIRRPKARLLLISCQ